MSSFLGPIRQLGYVVPDIEAAMEYWRKVMGVGPWFYNPRVPIEDYRYDGRSYTPHNSVALANSGYVQVELIQTRDDTPSMYRDFMRAGRDGLQHVAFWTQDYDADLARMIDLGRAPLMSGKVGADGRFVYFRDEGYPGAVIELSEVMGPKGRMFDMIRDAAVNWDGHDAIRPFPDLRAI